MRGIYFLIYCLHAVPTQCENLVSITPYVDIAPSEDGVNVQAVIMGVVDLRYSVKECKAINIDTNEEVSTEDVGPWRLECSFELRDYIISTDPSEVYLTTSEEGYLIVVDSTRMNAIISINQDEFHPWEEVEDKDSLTFGTCVLKYDLKDGYGIYVQELPTRQTQDETGANFLICSLDSPLEGKAYLGLSLSHQTTIAFRRISNSDEATMTAYQFLDVPLQDDKLFLLLNEDIIKLLKHLSPMNEVEVASNEVDERQAIERASKGGREKRDEASSSKRKSFGRKMEQKDESKPESADDSYKKYTKSKVKKNLDSMSKLISNPSQDATQGDLRQLMDKVVTDLKDYMKGLCYHQPIGTNVTVTISDFLAISGVKSTLLEGFLKKPHTIEPEGPTMKKVTVTWGKSLNSYKQWSCEGEDKGRCAGLCLFVVVFSDIFGAPLVKAAPPDNAIQSSNMIKLVVMNPKNQDIVPLPNNSKQPIKVEFEVTNKNSSKNTPLCYNWDRTVWTKERCTNELSNRHRRARANLQSCLCINTGYAAVFSTQGGISEGPTSEPTTVPVLYESKLNVTLVFEGTYSEQMQLNEFKENVCIVLSNKLGIDKGRIRVIDIRGGSVLVDVEITSSEGTRSSTSGKEQTLSALTSLLEDGFNITHIQQSLKLLDIRMDSQPVQAIDDSTLPILIGAIVGGVLLLAMVLFVMAIYFNKKKKMDKVTPLNSSSTMPTYMKMGNNDGLDGTIGSFSKIKSQASSGHSSYRGEDGFSVLRKSGNSSSRGDSGYNDEVPGPFKYQVPPKKMINSKIPDHIVKNGKARKLSNSVP